ncbi:MAG: AgmX/PglI C-terminal domain-containing protein [Pseudomonadota bacterium]|nr:AgmX/PglI C-terminal domain-containing protein [Pseudomonadota bacterium]
MADQRSTSFGAGPRLPWQNDHREGCRFGLILAAIALAFVVPAILIPGWSLPERERAEMEQLPPRLAKLVQQVDPEPVPEPLVTLAPEPEPELTEPQPKLTEPSAPTEVAPPTISNPEVPEPVENPANAQAQARETASKSGLFAMKDRLAALTATNDAPVQQVQANVDGNALAQQHERPTTQELTAGSGGVETTDGPRKDVTVEQHQVAEVSAPAEPVVASQPSASSKPLGAGERSMSNIRQVFDAQKSALYALYQRELRQDPSLAGKLTLELVIEPDGSVSDCKVVSSELENAALEQRIALRVRMFNFGAAEVDTRRVAFPIDFLPG